MVAGSGQHAFDLVIFSLFEDDLQPVCLQLPYLGLQRQRLIDELDAVSQLRQQLGRHWIMCRRHVDLRHMMLRRRLYVDEDAIVGEQQ